MADPNTDDISGYAQYLKSQGVSDGDIHGYTKYLADQHGVDHPSETQGSSWLDNQLPFGTTPRGIIQGAADALPTAGMVAGGVVGGTASAAETAATGGAGVVAAPALALGGAATGGAMGASLKDIIERNVLNKKNPESDIYTAPLKGAVQGATAEGVGQALGAGLEDAANSPAGQWAANKLGQAGSKIAESLSGIPQKIVDTYAQHTDEINDLAKAADNNPQELVDGWRQKTNATIQQTRQNLNSQISDALSSRADQTVDSQPIIDALNAQKAKINAKLRPEEIGQVDDLIGKVNAIANGGEIPLQDAQDLKELLQERAKGSYANNGQIFQIGSKAARAAKAGAATARDLVNEEAPEIADANGTLSSLHDIEDIMNRNMLAEGKTGASVFAAGSGANPANEKILKQLGDLTGNDILGEARKISAANTFGNPATLPVDATGKSLTRMGVGSALGGITGYEEGGRNGAIAGAIAGGALSSPAALKVAINAGSAGSDMVKSVLSAAPSLAGKAIEPDVPTPTNTNQNSTPVQPDIKLAQPLKGQDKWAADGFQNLMAHASTPDQKAALQKMHDKLMTDSHGRQLLESASDFKPGSKGMQSIMDQVQKLGGAN